MSKKQKQNNKNRKKKKQTNNNKKQELNYTEQVAIAKYAVSPGETRVVVDTRAAAWVGHSSLLAFSFKKILKMKLGMVTLIIPALGGAEAGG